MAETSRSRETIPADVPLHPNYAFLEETASKLMPEKGAILDFGCGKGDLVEELARKGWENWGCEFFGPGSGNNIREALEKKGLLGRNVLEYDGKQLPWSDAQFDAVASNQVLEHVPDLQLVLREISRVLRPGGLLVTTFPHRGCWREVHSNVWFVHMMKPGSKLRRSWLMLWRSTGFVRLKRRRTKREWVDFFDEWLVRSTFYLPLPQITQIMAANGLAMEHREADYLAYRLEKRGQPKLARLVGSKPLRPLMNALVRRYAGLVLVCRKNEEA